MSKTEDKILDLLDKAHKNKISADKKNQDEKLKADKQVLKEILALVSKKLIYKDIGNGWSHNYIVVTDDIVLNDYITEPNSWDRKTTITKTDGDMSIVVNGHKYYHLGGLFNKYEKQIAESVEYTSLQLETLYKQRENLKQVKENEPLIKRLMIDYQKNVGTL